VILSVLLLLVFSPVIFGLGAATEQSASGIPESGYLVRWLLATGVMFAAAAAVYAMTLAQARRRARTATRSTRRAAARD